MKYLCGIELGGTSSSAAIIDEDGKYVLKEKGITAENPATLILTLSNILRNSSYTCETLGIASFGPLNVESGTIGKSPKKGWYYFHVKAEFRKYFPDIPIAMETDVNAPAYSEFIEFSKKNNSIKSLAYLTIGTGIGLGLYSDGSIYHGRLHPEFGHTYIKKLQNDTFSGVCHIHGDCAEGLISASAISKRLGISMYEIRDIQNDHPIWDLYVEYVSQIVANAALAYSLDVFVIGGGVTTDPKRGFLYDRIYSRASELINDYIPMPLVVRPHFDRDAGLIGATVIARRKFNKINANNDKLFSQIL
ncbi:ROK family protein [Trichomonas vaginalis G3]|uniref:fructokinase n=1 Tax=Trichomonas vaginalis (strain ATCC PRA-98 / G3) TaxID=412133 RepID=A2ESX9_TRIV3|nr:ROK family [Trichomonas vaginalis G3]EAY04237.1 ROK family protein [Trichomonas vaginalis G3]KAI5550022.1 ROK family [Trichomonas vaginalis G3]|eukprot:XP_001316460.1 ROK family protein [Trichomonas vaginalis G3]